MGRLNCTVRHGWLVLALAGMPQLAHADLEDEVERAWVGAWVVVQGEAASDCSSFYTNNEVRGRRVTSKGSRRFSEGELARVDKLNTHSQRVDLYLSLVAPVLIPRQDGPFTLYDERSCRVQLMVDIPRQVLKGGKARAIEPWLLEVVERHETAALARQSGAWNRRERDKLPDNYQQTLARHAVWKAQETNRALARARQEALGQAASVLERVREDADYLAGFAAGAKAQRWRLAPSCGEVMNANFYLEKEQPPRDRQGDSSSARSFQQGFHDGQLLAWATRLARTVEECFVPVPPSPP